MSVGTKFFAVAEKGGILSAPVRPNSPGWVAQPPAPTAYLEDLPTTAAQAAKPVQQGKSVGGTPLTVKGPVFPHGLGVQAPTSLTYALDPAWARFVARVGYDDEAVKASEGSVIASVRIDGKVVAVTPRVDKTNRFSYLQVLIPPGSKTLDIVTEPGNPGEPPGTADWIDAGFTTSRRCHQCKVYQMKHTQHQPTQQPCKNISLAPASSLFVRSRS